VHVSDFNGSGAKQARRIRDDWLEGAVAIPNQDTNITLIDRDAGAAIGDNDVCFSDPAEVSDGDTIGIDSARIVSHSRLETSITITQHYANRARSAGRLSALVSDDGIQLAVTVYVTH